VLTVFSNKLGKLIEVGALLFVVDVQSKSVADTCPHLYSQWQWLWQCPMGNSLMECYFVRL